MEAATRPQGTPARPPIPATTAARPVRAEALLLAGVEKNRDVIDEKLFLEAMGESDGNGQGE